MTFVNQPNSKPTAKVVAATMGAPAAIILAWGLAQAGITMPSEVAAAVGSLLSSVLAYLMPDVRG